MIVSVILTFSTLFSTSYELEREADKQFDEQEEAILCKNLSCEIEGLLETVSKNLKQKPTIEGVDDEKIAKIYEFRKATAEQLEREQQQWLKVLQCCPKKLHVNYYFHRIKELKKRFMSIFNKKIKIANLLGSWECHKQHHFGSTYDTYEFKQNQVDSTESFFRILKSDIPCTLAQGRFWAKFDHFSNQPWGYIINLPHASYDARIEIGNYPRKIIRYDPWFLELVEEQLWALLRICYQDDHAINAIKEYIRIAFDQRLAMLPDGSLYHLKTSQEKNRELAHWVRETWSRGYPNKDVSMSNFNLKERLHPHKKMVWDFSIPGVYLVKKDGDIIQQGLVKYEDGKLKFFTFSEDNIKSSDIYYGYHRDWPIFNPPDQTAKKLSIEVRDSQPDVLETKRISLEDGELWFEYLFGPLEVARVWKKKEVTP